MRLLLATALVFLALSGCSKNNELPGRSSAPVAEAQAPQPKEAAAREAGRYLAYEHAIQLEVAEDKVVPLHEAVQAACQAAAEDACVLLESRLNTGAYASARLKLRAKPAGIGKLMAVLDAGGKVVSKSVSAEDLARPIADSAKQLELLTDYRNRLEALRGRASSDLDTLMKVNRELAQVQSEIEALAGNKAHLMQRVETEILDVSIGSVRGNSFWRPIVEALSDFGATTAGATASAITAVAYLLPWALVASFFLWGARRLWRRRSKEKKAG